MTEIKMKYGFPLFSRPTSLVSLGKNEKLVISDIWAFWDYVIKKVSKDRKEEDFLKSLLEQAKHFYITAEGSPVKSQPLLYYYSFLNLSKIIINLSCKHGPRKMYMHGMTEKHNHKFAHSTITKQKQKIQIVQVAHELVSIFDPNISTGDTVINVRELMNHCVGVHRAYSEIYNQSEVFYRLKSQKLYKNGRELVFKAELQCSASDLSSLTARGYAITQEDESIYYTENLQCLSIRQHAKTTQHSVQQFKARGFGILSEAVGTLCICQILQPAGIAKNRLSIWQCFIWVPLRVTTHTCSMKSSLTRSSGS